MIDRFEISVDSDDSSSEEHTSSYSNVIRDEGQGLMALSAKWASKKRTYGKSPLITDTLKLKCLRVRDYRIKSAMNLLSNYLAWYQQLTKGRAITIDMVRKHLEAKIIYCPPVVDVEHDPILVFNANYYYVDKCPVNEFIKTLLYCLERISDSTSQKVTLLANTHNWTMANLSYRNASAFFDTLRKHFPVDIKRIILHNPPSWLPKVLGLIAPLIGKLMERIKFANGNQILQYVNAQNLVPEMGGENQFDMSVWIRSRYEAEQVEYRH